MDKIILFYVLALLMIFPLNATTPRKLGTHYSAITSMLNTNKVANRGAAGQYSLISSLPVHKNTETDPHILGSGHNVVTGVPNTKETSFDEPGYHQYLIISRSPADHARSSADHANIATPRIPGTRSSVFTSMLNINDEANYGASEQQDSHIPSYVAHTNEATATKLEKRPNPTIITSLSNTNEATSTKLEKLPNPIIITSLPNTNEATSTKLGKRPNPIIITSLPNTNKPANSGDLGLRYFPFSSSPTQTDVETHHSHRFSSSQAWKPVQFKVTPRKLWASIHNGVTSLSNTNKAITSRVSAVQHSPISTSLAQTHATTRHILQTRVSAVTSLSNTNNEITSRGSSAQHSPISISSSHTQATTPRILQTRVSADTSLSNTNATITSRRSGVNHSPISSSSAHTHTTTHRMVLGARHNTITSSPKANEATIRKHGTRENPIIITNLPNTNKATKSGKLGLNFFPFSNSSSPTQINRVIPRGPDETGHVSSIIN